MESEIQRALDALNPNTGAVPGSVIPKALKTLSSYIAPTLFSIFNLSLQTSQILDNWRHAIVIPVAKPPHTTDPNLYQPISLTSVVCKALEAILKEKMLANLSQFFSLLSSRQHGFLPRSSPQTYLLTAEEFITKWFSEETAVDLINLDFSKAFDLVNDRLLIAKLRGYGIAPIVICLAECFLSRRTFQVNANGTLSQTAEAISGAAQGSAPGPILFVIYATDLPDRLSADRLLYADGVTLIARRNRYDVLQKRATSQW